MMWQDGSLIGDEPVRIDADDRGLLLGDGLFETLKVARGRALFLDRHLCRMAASARALGLSLDRSRLREGISAVLAAAGLDATGALRLTVTRGPGPRGLGPIPNEDQRPAQMVRFFPTTSHAPPRPSAPHPADRLVIAPWKRSAGAPTSHHKTLSYADNLAARAWADERGAADAIFLNDRGAVASTTMANLFVDQGDDGYATPPLSTGILPGVTRAILLEEARAAGIPITVRPMTPADLSRRRLFRTSSLLGVVPGFLVSGGEDPVPLRDAAPLAALYRAAERREEES